MTKKWLLVIVCIYFLTFPLWNCKNIRKSNSVKDNFYTDKGSWDAVRVPLLKPYELIRLNGSKEWTMNLEASGSVTNIKEINVVGNTIIIHADQTYCNNIQVQEAWFVIIPEKHIENGYDNQKEFKEYLALLKKENIKLHNVEEVYKVFSKNDKISWDSDFN